MGSDNRTCKVDDCILYVKTFFNLVCNIFSLFIAVTMCNINCVIVKSFDILCNVVNQSVKGFLAATNTVKGT